MRNFETTLFSLYIPKHYKQASKLPRFIEEFICKNKKQYDIVIAPGYLSRSQKGIFAMKRIFHGKTSSLTVYGGMSKSATLRINKMYFPANYIDTEPDHRKMIFFIYNGMVEGILIGSSNFSKSTYFGKSKGEADIFFFVGGGFEEYCRGIFSNDNVRDRGLYDSCVLSQSLWLRENPSTFLTKIYQEFVVSKRKRQK